MKVLADTVGSVSQFHADTGAHVAEGERIGELECMKTLFTIYAPCSGVLRWVVLLGEVVGQDQVLAEVT